VDTEISEILGLEIDGTDKRAVLWNTPRRLFDGVE
jgi:hypothetical protein